jgi:hypothetical protein
VPGPDDVDLMRRLLTVFVAASNVRREDVLHFDTDPR